MKILLVIDMQEDFINGIFETPEAKAIVLKVKEYVDSYDGEIFYTKDTHLKESYQDTLEGKNYQEHCMLGTSGHDLVKELKPAKGKIILKPTFGSTELVSCLINLNNQTKITVIDVVGVYSDICVITNVLLLRTYFKDTVIRVHKDLCAGTTKQNHENSMQIMKGVNIEVL